MKLARAVLSSVWMVAAMSCSSADAPDATPRDAGGTDTLDVGGRDASIDAPAGDAGTLDAAIDVAAPDTGSRDTGGLDVVRVDTGMDSGRADSGAPDAGTRDASADGGGGPGPTQQCPRAPDADGFFTLMSASVPYVARLPNNYNAQTAGPLPLLVMIHGCGDSAMNFATWGGVPWASRATQNYIMVSVGGREGACWTVPGDTTKVTDVIAHVRSCFYVHQKKIVLAGYSSGGMLAYNMGLRSAANYAGILIENSGLSQAVGGNNVASTLASAAWKINIAHTARLSDGSFAIAGVRADRNAINSAGFPLDYRELAGTHDGTSDDWSMFLIPHIANWTAP